MRVVRGGDLAAEQIDHVVTIGVYDGVHLGHRAVLGAVGAEAARRSIASAVVTFDRHPAQILRPDAAPLLLTDIDQKLELLESTGIDDVVVVHFDNETARERPEHFVKRVLVEQLRARLVVVGEDFHFGFQRSGNVELLREAGRDWGFDVIGHRLVGSDGAAARPERQVSSTAIRRALTEGRLADANAMLGRAHELRGTVVTGDQRGRTIGFPTANVAVATDLCLPSEGIYAGGLRRADGTELDAAIYLGRRPTFYDDRAAMVLEVHCLDWSGDLYGEPVAVTFTDRLRGDQRFDSVDALATQLQLDCDDARRRRATRRG
ncbi:MAG: bifunctional riboflavin kinase/FAD synthetase [Actinobacteria bacterium]|jgi:riboflavin kinase/FMN adenylyltransferase|nr:bifunctional riboflavin kinase/FAD synthetase [Actinomycetota bacterium]